MKRLKIISLVIVLMLSLSLWGIMYIHNVNDDMSQIINDALILLEQNNYDGAKNKLDEAIVFWNDTKSILTMYIQHENIDEVTRQLSYAKENLNFELFSETHLILTQIIFTLNQIYQNALPTLSNIF